MTLDPEQEWCGCLGPLSVSRAVRDVLDELAEFVKAPSKDELSDICFGVGRLLGAFTGKPYRTFPGAELHIEKITRRMIEHGCVRSARHLSGGECPSASLGSDLVPHPGSEHCAKNGDAS